MLDYDFRQLSVLVTNITEMEFSEDASILLAALRTDTDAATQALASDPQALRHLPGVVVVGLTARLQKTLTILLAREASDAWWGTFFAARRAGTYGVEAAAPLNLVHWVLVTTVEKGKLSVARIAAHALKDEVYWADPVDEPCRSCAEMSAWPPAHALLQAALRSPDREEAVDFLVSDMWWPSSASVAPVPTAFPHPCGHGSALQHPVGAAASLDSSAAVRLLLSRGVAVPAGDSPRHPVCGENPRGDPADPCSCDSVLDVAVRLGKSSDTLRVLTEGAGRCDVNCVRICLCAGPTGPVWAVKSPLMTALVTGERAAFDFLALRQRECTADLQIEAPEPPASQPGPDGGLPAAFPPWEQQRGRGTGLALLPRTIGTALLHHIIASNKQDYLFPALAAGAVDPSSLGLVLAAFLQERHASGNTLFRSIPPAASQAVLRDCLGVALDRAAVSVSWDVDTSVDAALSGAGAVDAAALQRLRQFLQRVADISVEATRVMAWRRRRHLSIARARQLQVRAVRPAVAATDAAPGSEHFDSGAPPATCHGMSEWRDPRMCMS
jgi:hypothetical protein